MHSAAIDILHGLCYKVALLEARYLCFRFFAFGMCHFPYRRKKFSELSAGMLYNYLPDIIMKSSRFNSRRGQETFLFIASSTWNPVVFHSAYSPVGTGEYFHGSRRS